MRWLAIGLLFSAGLVRSQTLIPPVSSLQIHEVPQLSPQAAYDEAARPVDIVHRAVSNWSEVEQAALGVAVGKAAAACAARDPYQYKGEDLLAYARLCAFAQMWEQVQQASTGYLSAENTANPEKRRTGFPNLSMAFDYTIQASLHLGNTANAFGTAQTMMRTVAYDDLVSEAVNGVARYVQLIQTDEALVLLVQRQPELLSMLKARGAASAAVQEVGEADALRASARPPLTIHDIYADAIQLAAMQQFAKEPEAAQASYAELEAALPQNLSADDAILIGELRGQYRLLGAPLPEITVSASLLNAAAPKVPELNRKDAGAGALLLFPDWCAQCVAMNPRFKEVSKGLKGKGISFYALLAQANPAAPPPKPVVKTVVKSASGGVRSGKPTGAVHVEIQAGTATTAADQLMGTPTLIVPVRTVEMFAATDFPLLVVTDGCGLVRYAGVAPENVLADGGLIYQVAERVLRQWPRMACGVRRTE